MRILRDENIDRLFKALFAPEFEVMTVSERGWEGKANGDLLRFAEREFDALVTMDRNLECQQNLPIGSRGSCAASREQRLPGRSGPDAGSE